MCAHKQNSTFLSKKNSRTAARFLAFALTGGLLFGFTGPLNAPAAYAAEEQESSSGDPIYGDEPRLLSTDTRQLRIATDGLSDIKSWSPAVKTNAVTSAYIDLAADKVYQASRSEDPATTYINRASNGSIISQSDIQRATGSWEMAVNGNFLAIGTNGVSGTGVRPRIIVRDKNNNKLLSDTSLPSSTSTGAYIMAMAPDSGDSRVFWVGTYDSKGARLYKFNASTKKLEDFTPGNEWSKKGAEIKYVRSLAHAGGTLSIGMGNPSSLWILPDGAKAPHKAVNALAGLNASTVYAQAAVPNISALQIDEADAGVEGSESAETAETTEDVVTGSESAGETETAPTEDTGSVDTPQSVALEGTVEGEQSEEATQPAEVAADEDSETANDNVTSDDATGSDVTGDDATNDVAITDDANGDTPATVAAQQLFVTGTNTPAAINVVNQNGTNVARHLLSSNQGKTVDRIAVDNNHVAWFTLRPSGDLYRLDLDVPGSTPQFVTATVHGAETRALTAQGDIVAGVTGTRQLWKYNTANKQIEVIELARNNGERPDATTQGILAAPNATLVGGHWRYQVQSASGKSTNIYVPGEPKAQIVAGNDVYSAIYPAAELLKVDVGKGKAETVAKSNSEQFRPRDLVQNKNTGMIYMATSSAYGTYGGGITQYDPKTGKSQFFNTPVAGQAPFAISPIGNGLIIGMSPSGEAVEAPRDAKTAIVRWENGRVLWKQTLSNNDGIMGVATIKNGRGDFVFATSYQNKAYALDGQTGAILWQSGLPGSGNRVSAADNYVLVKSGDSLIEYFPTRSALTKGKTLATGVAWGDLQKRADGALEVAVVANGSASATRARIAKPREVLRVRGANRYETTLAASRQEFTSADTAVIATGADFPDALCAGPLANAVNGPILLNSRASLRSDVSAELSRLGVKKVYIAGGTGVISTNVKTAIEKKGIKVERLGGKDRFDTSINIANKVRALSGKGQIPVVATTGMLFPDALSATPAATKMGGAIILTRENKIPAQVATYLRSPAVGNVATVGGLAERAVRSAGIQPVWTATGKNRYETSNKVAARIDSNAKSVYVATGSDFPDGLAAGTVAAKSNSPVMLTKSAALSPAVTSPLRGATKVTVFGGTGVVVPKVLTEIRSL